MSMRGPLASSGESFCALRSAGASRRTMFTDCASIAAFAAATSAGERTPRMTRNPLRSKRKRSCALIPRGGGGSELMPRTAPSAPEAMHRRSLCSMHRR